MKRSLVLVALCGLLACGESPTDAGGDAPDVTEARPITGRWIGSAETGEQVDVTITEIRGDVGGAGVVVSGSEQIQVAVEGRHVGRDVTLRLSAGSRGWNFVGVLADSELQIRGAWTTFTGSAALSLVKCVPGTECG